ncbi:MAG: 2-hydroxyacid dehydrogenase [Verrucomicrobiia bacterium]
MKVAVFSTKDYDRTALAEANAGGHELVFFEAALNAQTAPVAKGYEAVCVFVHDEVDAEAVKILAGGGVRLVALRCAGFNNVDLAAAREAGLTVVRVPAYSPHAVAEFTVGLILALNRKYHRAYARTRDGNFSIDGLLGFDLHGKTVGVIGTGKIGLEVVRILAAFGCRLLGYDQHHSEEAVRLGLEYVALGRIWEEADVITLHCPLLPETHHLISGPVVARLKPGVMLVNTSRGGLVDAVAVAEGIKDGKIGALGLDVYEEEEGVFFEDWSETIINDDLLLRLLAYPNVLITSHQAFFTREALGNIARTTLGNLDEFAATGQCRNRL